MTGTGLYDDVIMDHIRNARNYRVLEDADREATGNNPLCGDEIVVYVNIAGDHIGDIAFQCTCCGISMASASIMTEMVKGKLAQEVTALLRDFMAMISGRGNVLQDQASTEWRAILDTVQRFPTRARCAALPWSTLQDALARESAVSVR